MNKNLKIARYNSCLLIIAIALLILVLGATSCDLVFPKSGQYLNKFIKSYWGIDVTSDLQINGMIAAGRIMGDKEAVNGLSAYMHCRSELYQERGDKLLSNGDTDGARAQYEEAIKYATDNTPHQASDKAGIYLLAANTYLKDAQNKSNASERWPLFRASGQDVLKAAEIEPVTEYKAYYYREAAFRLATGGDKLNGKKAYDEAAKLEPNNLSLLALADIFKK